MYEHGEKTISDEELRDRIAISPDPEVHAEAVREVERMGATIIALANVSGADPLGAIDVYREKVLPALRGSRVSWPWQRGQQTDVYAERDVRMLTPTRF